MTTPDRIRPVTAQELLAAHQEVSVSRDRLGVMRVSRKVGEAIGSLFTVQMSASTQAEPELVLTLVGDMHSGSEHSLTRLKIPVEGGLYHAWIDAQGTTEPEQLIHTARAGTALFADYIDLPEQDRWDVRYEPGGTERVYDEMRPVDDTLGVYTTFGLYITEEQLAFDTFAAARHIFLDVPHGNS